MSDDGTGADSDFAYFHLHAQLDILLKLRKSAENSIGSGGELRMLTASLRFVRDLVGPDLFTRAMGYAGPGNGLHLLAHRLDAVGPLLSDNWPEDFSYGELIDEAVSVAGGDAPRIFRQRDRRNGKKPNAFTLTTLRLNALTWGEVLRRRGGRSAEEVDHLIAESYGTTAPALRKWKFECLRKLGSELVGKAYTTQAAIHDVLPSFELMSDEQVILAISRDGHVYREEMRKGPETFS